jgi:uncharacterized protein (TIRG00374 family)
MSAEKAGKARARAQLKLGLKVSVSVACIGYLALKLDGSALSATVLGADGALIAVGVVLLLLLSGVQTARWLLVARSLDIRRVTWMMALQSVLIGMFFNQTLPSSMGGDAVRVWRLRNSGAPFSAVLNSVIIERLFALAGMVLISFVALGLLLHLHARWEIILGLLLVDAVAAAAIVVLSSLDKLPLTNWLKNYRPGSLIQGFSIDLRQVLASKSALYVVGLSVGIHIAVSAIFWLLAKSIGVALGFATCLAFVPVVLLITTVPISVAGWGVRETGVVTLFSLVGVPAVQSLAVSIIFGIAVAAAAIPGGIVWLVTKSAGRNDAAGAG